MMRYRLRTLLIVLALGPLILSVGYRAWRTYDETRWRDQDIESFYGTGTPHKIRTLAPPPLPGHRYWQRSDGMILQEPVNPIPPQQPSPDEN